MQVGGGLIMATGFSRSDSTELVDHHGDQEYLTSIIKEVHSRLREELKNTDGDIETVWSSHLNDSQTLNKYASAMHSLATGPWRHNHDEESRITWCRDSIREFFSDDALLRLLQKDIRRLEYGNPTILDNKYLPKSQEELREVITSFRGRPLDLLDVGSCYNPFKIYTEFTVTAVDIAPATKDVQYCDFLSINISPADVVSPSHECSASTFSASSFDIVIFSLFLSYLPSPELRLKCCINAHKLLIMHGVLLIITADSSHQNKHVDMMRSWKDAIESLGFHRWKYTKQTHLHCIAFRKTKDSTENYTESLKKYSEAIYISQDTK